MNEKIMQLYPNTNPLVLDVYKGIAIDLIESYLKNINVSVKKEEIESKYESALLLVVCNAIEGKNTNNIKQMSQGNKSITYGENKAFIISDDVKALLPLPRVKMMGWYYV